MASSVAGGQDPVLRCLGVRGRLVSGYSPLAYPEGGELGGLKKFVLRVCKIYSPSPALIFIKSKILYRKTLKNEH